MKNQDLDAVFGPGDGSDIEKRAQVSSVQYVRSQDQLSVFTGKETGRVYNAREAYHLFGFDKLLESRIYGTAILAVERDEPSLTIRKRREDLGLSLEDVATSTGLHLAEVQDIEDNSKTSKIRSIEMVARALGLNDSNISRIHLLNKDNRLAVRLKTFSEQPGFLTSRDLAKIAEAAWVVNIQSDLMRKVKNKKRLLWEDNERDPNYGSHDYPAWRHGYYLAYKTREMLDLSHELPIESLRELCENRLEIPLLYCDLNNGIAGVTISIENNRGIVINSKGIANTWIKRISLAHEIAHLLWDDDESLVDARVDSYKALDLFLNTDFVEQRANAFAVEFLAPQRGIEEMIKAKIANQSDISPIMKEYGISFTSAKYHFWNTVDRAANLESIKSSSNNPTPDWDGRERYTLDYFPMEKLSDSRRGSFAKYVVEANRLRFISDDTAASYLACDIETYAEKRDMIAELFA